MTTNKMERFTRQARHVLTITHDQAVLLGQNTILPCHILLGMLQASGSVAHQALAQAGLSYPQVLALIQDAMPLAEEHHNPRIELSSETKRLLEGAVDQARRLGHHYVGTEHLLLALMGKPDGITSRVLEKTEISQESVRQYTRQILQERSPEVLISHSPSMPFPAASPERMKVLHMIEAGKITADEGIRLLEVMNLTAVVPPQLSHIIRLWSHRLH